MGDGDHVRVGVDDGEKVTPGQGGGDFRCQLPCEYQADKAWKVKRHQNQKQGCIRSFEILIV